jgi:predicted acetyltransferase
LSGPLAIRTAREQDLDRLIEIHSSAFPDSRGVEARGRLLRSNYLGDLDHLYVAERGGLVLAHAFLFALQGWFGGTRVNFGGIASVGVAPEARGEAVARALLDELHRRANERGDALTLLYPFRQGFYERSGFVAVSPTLLLTLHPRAIPEFWADPAQAPGIVRAATGSDRSGILAAYDAVARKRTGWIVRPERLWENRLVDERRRWFVLDREGSVAGYVCWTLKQQESHAEIRLDVGDLVASDEPARRRLLALVGAQRDQVAEVTLEVGDDDPIDRALVDMDSARHGSERVEHALGALVGGPMVRLADDTRAIEARGYRSDGVVDLAVDGAPPTSVEIRDGVAKVGPPRGGPLVQADRRALAAVLYGGLSASDAARLGWLTADTSRTLRLADDLFAQPPFFALDTF